MTFAHAAQQGVQSKNHGVNKKDMEQLPIFFQCKGKTVAVCGGTTPAARRTELALRAGASVRLFAPAPGDDFRTVITHGRLTHLSRSPSLEDLQGCCLAFIATGAAEDDRGILALAREANVPANVADAPGLCDFTMPSIVDRDPLIIAISTGGASPVFARIIRARLESLIPAAYGRLVSLVAAHRNRLSAAVEDSTARRRFWERFLEGPLADRFLSGQEDAAQDELERALESRGQRF